MYYNRTQVICEVQVKSFIALIRNHKMYLMTQIELLMFTIRYMLYSYSCLVDCIQHRGDYYQAMASTY